MNTKSIILITCLVSVVACGGGGGGGGSGGTQEVVINFDSVNATYVELVSRTYDLTPVPIFGTLLLPTDLSSKVPAMIIAHGTSGVTQGREFEWARYLNSLGIAAFIVDSFTPRGIGAGGIDPFLNNGSFNVVDALKALELLSSHPNIDVSRIGVMGGSRGGSVSYITAFEEARAGIINGAEKFAAHIPFYPSCSVRRRSLNMTGAPLLFLLAELDDYTPAAACGLLAAEMANVVADVTTIVYPNAYHGFDLDTTLRMQALSTFRACAAEQRLDTLELRRYDTGQLFADFTEFNDYLDSCVQLGVMIGADRPAEDQAKIDVGVFLKRVFNL